MTQIGGRAVAGLMGLSIALMLFGGHRPGFREAHTVAVTFRVVAPDRTPPGDRLYWSGTLNRWDPGPEGIGQHPWSEEEAMDRKAGEWTLTLDVPRGDTARYRYTRGSVFSAEGAADGGERSPRQAVADAAKTVVDTVAAWRDIPDPAKAASWFTVPLDTAHAATMRREGEATRFWGTILYATDRVREFFRGYSIDDEVHRISEALTDTVLYVRRMSGADERNAVRVLGGRTGPDAPWQIYLDADNDGRLGADEHVMEIPPDAPDRIEERVAFDYDVAIDGAAHTRTVEATLWHLPDPSPMQSSSRRDAPTLVLWPEFDVRAGTLEMPDTTLAFIVRRMHLGHGLGWRAHHNVLVDQDGDGVYDWSPGSDEFYAFQEPFRLGYLHLEVADIDPHGRWVRLRPAGGPVAGGSMQTGDPAPPWDDVVFAEADVDPEWLRGRYVLLDFWATWCAPCLAELPNLRAAHERFASEDFAVVGVVYNDRRANVERMAERRGVVWPQIYDPDGGIADRFNVRGIPDPVLIGPDGAILERGARLRGDALVRTLRVYLE